MPIPNLPQLSPRAGNGLGGMPKKPDSVGGPTVATFLIPFSGSTNTTFPVPPGYKTARISIIGKGGTNLVSSQYYGGNGGGCSISQIFQIIPGERIFHSESSGNQTVAYGSIINLYLPAANNASSDPVRPSGGVKNYIGGKGAIGSSTAYSGGGAATLQGDGQPGNSNTGGQNGPTEYEGRAEGRINGAGKGYGFGAMSSSVAGDSVIYLELWP